MFPLRWRLNFPSRVACFALGVCGSAMACGPFFPETVLDQPRATLRPPIANFEAEVRQLVPPSAPPAVAPPKAELSDNRPGPQGSLEAAILDPEVAELEATLADQPEERRRKLVKDYRALRAAMLLKFSSGNFSTYGLHVPPEGYQLLAEAQRGNWPDGLPGDIVLYLEGALRYDYGQKHGAIEIWKRLLALPENERRNRSVAAAWMIARATRETADLEAAQPWYARCIELSTSGLPDPLELGLSSLGWQARLALDQGDRRRALEIYYHQALAGLPGGWTSLLRALPSVDKLSDAELEQWADDPFLRGLLTAQLLRESFSWDGSFSDPSDDRDVVRWLDAIERAEVATIPEAAKFAELAYTSGQFDLARRWFERAPQDDPRALWIHGKLALMVGNTKAAEKALLAARKGFPRDQTTSDATIMMVDSANTLSPQTAMTYRTSQFYGDLGATHLARNHFTEALGAFRLGAFDLDAAYVAERVLGPEELLTYVRRHASEPTGAYFDRGYQAESVTSDRKLRYLLARRLARMRYFKDAREFYPDDLQPVFDRYVSLFRRSRDTSVPESERTAALWETAQIHRALGMELFGTEGEPDAFVRGGNFPADSYIQRRLGVSFAKNPFDWWAEDRRFEIVPPPTADERARVRQSRMPCEERFQYRYIAADLAWKAAEKMPRNSEETARVLGIAGSWLATRDPEAADRFYKAMIWRNWSTPLAREADAKRWFPAIAWEYDPWAAEGVARPEGL